MSIFSSNQVLQISGDFDQLKNALDFALKYSGENKNMLPEEIKRGCRLTYQITKNNKYCIGWAFLNRPNEKLPNGWSEYPFKFDVEIVSKIIIQYLNDFPIEKDIWDGGYKKGFLMKVIPETFSDADDIKNAFYGIVSFEPFTCFYSK